MALLIWLPVATVNAIIFFAIDTPALYAIHRGLFALQGYYLHTRVQAGIKVQLVRSKIPIVGGELLHGTTGLPSIFVLFNLGALICLFFATLGVEAEERNWWVSSPFQYTTTLSQKSINMTFLHFGHSATLNLSCKTGNRTNAHYWHVAFNESGELLNNRSLVKNVICQANAPHTQPMLSAQCVPASGETGCLLDAFPQMYSFEGRKSSTIVHKITDSIEVEEQFYTNYSRVSRFPGSGSPQSFSGIAARVFVYRTIDLSQRNISNSPAYFFFYDSPTDSWLFSFGLSIRSQFLHRTPVRFSLQEKIVIDSLFTSMRTKRIAEFSISSGFAFLVETDISAFYIFERFLIYSLRAVPSSASTPTFVKMPIEDVTILSTTSTVCCTVLLLGLPYCYSQSKNYWSSHWFALEKFLNLAFLVVSTMKCRKTFGLLKNNSAVLCHQMNMRF